MQISAQGHWGGEKRGTFVKGAHPRCVAYMRRHMTNSAPSFWFQTCSRLESPARDKVKELPRPSRARSNEMKGEKSEVGLGMKGKRERSNEKKTENIKTVCSLFSA